MTYREIHNLYSAALFAPFEIVHTNGTRLLVDHPEFMAFSRDHRTVFVYERSGGLKRVDVQLVISLDDVGNGSRPRNRKR